MAPPECASGRLQSDEAATGCRHSDRAAGIGGMRNRDDPGRNRPRRAAGGAARGPGRIERIATDRPDRRFAGERKTEFRTCRQAEQAEAGVAKPGSQIGIRFAALSFKEAGTRRHGQSSKGTAKVLRQGRHPRKGPPRKIIGRAAPFPVAGVRCGETHCGIEMSDRAERLMLHGRVDGGLHRLCSAQAAMPDRRRQLSRVALHEPTTSARPSSSELRRCRP